jgi:membrane-bound ClpP family serine protease
MAQILERRWNNGYVSWRWLVLIATMLVVLLPVTPQAQPADLDNESTDTAATEGNVSDDSNAATKEEGDAASDAAPPEGEFGEGRLIRVRLPLSGNADAHLKSSIQRALAQLTRLPARDGRRPVLILELVPQRRHGGDGEGTDFTRALSVADFLTRRELAAVKTVAYVPRTIKGHGVLVALACEEIVMHPDAEIGDAGIDEDASRGIDPKVVSSYQQIAAARRTVPEAIALGMLDRRLEVLKVETDQSTEFILRQDLEALKQNHTIVSQDTLVPAGSLASFSGREGREYGFVKLLATGRDALARGLALSPDAVVEDQSLVGDWRPVMLTVEGPLTPRKVRQLETLVATEIRNHNVNWIGLTIDSPGGELADCLRLADTLAALDANEVQTVAYVPVEASGGAALVALACNQVVLQPEAHVGGKGTIELDRQIIDAATVSIRDSLSHNTDHSWSLLAATIDPDIELFHYQNTKTGEVRYCSAEETAEQPDSDDWRKSARIKPAGETLQLAANRAQELGVATHVVDSFDEFKQLYGFEADPRTAEPNWALELVEALSSPALAFLLLVIGFVGIYIELHTPGLGAGAFVAALAFMLFFWSNFLHGTAGWLEVLLFVGGIFFLLLEMLVLPGFGVFGLGGGLMILASLVLASQTFVLPRTESQMAELRHSLTIVAAATVVVIAASIALRRYLPQAPVFRTLLLSPAPEEELIDLDHRESLADFSHLIGQQGTATTNLMPAGKAEFEGQLIDVIAEGLPIERGQAVVVTKTRGNRVLVRAVDS